MGVAEVTGVGRLRDDSVAATGELCSPVVRRMTFDVEIRTLRRCPGIESGIRAVEHPPSGADRHCRALAVMKQAGRNLEQNLRLGVAAHRAEH